jgi:uncharacterized membrane protein YdbT with pleckstrin-like domain
MEGFGMAKMTYVWKDRKRTFLGLPLSFTVYKLTEEKLMIETGCFSKKEEEIRLYRIMDMTLNRPFGQRLFGLGTIHCCTADKSTPEFDILKIKRPRQVKEMLSDMVEEQRHLKGIAAREFMSDGDPDMDGDGHP